MFERTILTSITTFVMVLPVVAADKKRVEAEGRKTYSSVGSDQGRKERSASFRLLRATMIIGQKVEDPQGQELGYVHELAIDVSRRRLAYAVLDFGGLLPSKDKYFAVPFGALTSRFDPDDQMKMALDIEGQRLKEAPGFDGSEWPDMADQRWANEVFAFYGQRPYWEADRSSSLKGEPISAERKVVKKHKHRGTTVTQQTIVAPQRGSVLKASQEIIGHPVKHASNGEVLGEIEDLFVDHRTGDVGFVVVKLNPNSSARQHDRDREFVALPVQMFSFDRHGDPNVPYTIECCLLKLKEHRFSASHWPDLTSRSWAASLYDDFGRTPYWERK